MGLPADVAGTLLQQHVNSTLQGHPSLSSIQVNQPLQVVTQNTNNVITQRSVQGQVSTISKLQIFTKCFMYYYNA